MKNKWLVYGALGGVALWLFLRLKKQKKENMGGGTASGVSVPTTTTGATPSIDKDVVDVQNDVISGTGGIKPVKEITNCEAEWQKIAMVSRWSSAEAMEKAKASFMAKCKGTVDLTDLAKKITLITETSKR